MNTNLFTNTYAKWNSWNKQVNIYTDQAIQSCFNFFPRRYDSKLAYYRTHVKMALMSVTFFAILTSIYSTSSFRSNLRYFLGTVVIIFIGGPILSEASKLHIVTSVFNIMSRQLGNFYSTFNCQSQLDQFNKEIQGDIEQLEPQVKEVQEKIKHFDTFVKERPNLLNQCEQYLEQEKELVAIVNMSNQYISLDLDLTDPIDKRTQLIQALNQAEYLWKARMNFLERNPNFKENILIHMQQTQVDRFLTKD